MNVFIGKLGATGDVVRTSTLLRRLKAHVTWVTAAKNTVLLEGMGDDLRCFSWENRELAHDRKYDLIINLEDTPDVGQFVDSLGSAKRFGAYLDGSGEMRYTEDSRAWFDLSLISVYGRAEADRLKLRNRRTYQDLVFSGLGFQFNNDAYVLPTPPETGLKGDVAISPEGGPVWPMKNWVYYEELKQRLEAQGLTVNKLPQRASLLEHLGDVRNHRVLVSGDSLPMHLGLGTGVRCVTLFTCTSPWEIHDYGLQTKIVSPLLEEFFYKRGYDRRATTANSVDEVFDATMKQIELSAGTRPVAVAQ
jgi:ADP-heptose:LPS heptosyltransferase